jgi:hypothetical protein
MTVPATFIGLQFGFGDMPPIELYTLLAPLGDHPVGSTVSRQTLEKHGFTQLPSPPVRKRRRWSRSKPPGLA